MLPLQGCQRRCRERLSAKCSNQVARRYRMTGPREDPIARYEHTLIHEGSARLSSVAASKSSTTSHAISDKFTVRNAIGMQAWEDG
jgi:hypothetical protein